MIDPDEVEPVAALAEDLELDGGRRQVTVDGVDASLEIRGPEVTSAVSIVAANPRRPRRAALPPAASGPSSTAAA